MKNLVQTVGISLVVLILLPFNSYSTLETTGNFKYWDCNQSQVFGLYKIDNTAGRNYYKITIVSDGSKIEQYNTQGVLIGITIIKFNNGNIVSLSEANRWNYVIKTKRYRQLNKDEFMVTEIVKGVNSNLPCKGVKYSYSNGVLDKETFLSFDDKPMANNDGVAVIKYKRWATGDNFSLLQNVEYFDENEKPVISAEKDCHKISYDRDSKGNIISKAYFDISNSPIKDRYGASKYVYEYDNNDIQMSEAYFDVNNKPINNVYGVAVSRYTIKNGLRKEMHFFDDQNNVSLSGKVLLGSSTVKYSYDDNGNMIKQSFYDENGSSNLCNEGYSEVRYKYSDIDMLIETSLYDNYGRAVNDKEGIHRRSYVNDDKGRNIQIAFYDKEDKPTKNRIDRVYAIKYRYDDEGRIVSTSYWQGENLRMNRWDGFQEGISKFNDLGQIIEDSKFDAKGELIKTQGGYSKQIITHNNAAQVIERGFYDGNLPVNILNVSIATIKNYHSIKYTYNSQNRISAIEYLDDKNEPTNATISIEKNTFNCNKVEFIYRGEYADSDPLIPREGDPTIPRQSDPSFPR